MPTYVYLAHGGECTVPSNNGKRVPNRQKTIPEGCTLSTITESGIESNITDIARLVRMASVAETKWLMMEPVENYDALSVLFSGLDNEYLVSIPEYKKLSKEAYFYGNTAMGPKIQYHLKTEGERYSERSFELLFHTGIDKDTVTMYRSGIYDIERNDYPPLSTKISVSVSKEDADLPVSDFLNLYEGSVYPTQDEIKYELFLLFGDKQMMSFWDITYVIMQFKKKQSELLDEFPGNHYNFSCRSYNDENTVNKQSAKLARENSFRIIQSRARPRYNTKLSEYKTHVNAIKKLRPEVYLINLRLQLFSEKEELGKAQIKGLVEYVKYLVEFIDKDKGIIIDDTGKTVNSSLAMELYKNINKCVEKGFIDPSEIEGFDELKGLLTRIYVGQGGKRSTRKKKRSSRR